MRQGYPLSGLLLIIAIELLGNSIRQAKDIKGINVGLNEIKLTQYADDTTVFVSDVSSAKSLVELLNLFYECSGLKINSSKSEFLWLGPDRDSNDQVLNFLPPEDTVYALGVHFSYNKNAAEKKNFISKLEALKTLLNMWMIRDLSLYGKVQIIKSLALSKFTFICSVLPSPIDFESKVNSITFNLLWNNKPAKIKKSTIIANKKQGGL